MFKCSGSQQRLASCQAGELPVVVDIQYASDTAVEAATVAVGSV